MSPCVCLQTEPVSLYMMPLTIGPACFTAVFVVWEVSLEKGKFDVDEQYINAHMTLNTQYQNMTFKAFIYLTIKWQHPRGSFRGMPARRLLWILWFHCKGNVNLMNVNIFVHLRHIDCISFLTKNGTDHSDTAHWTSNWQLKPNLKKFPATAVVPT